MALQCSRCSRAVGVAVRWSHSKKVEGLIPNLGFLSEKFMSSQKPLSGHSSITVAVFAAHKLKEKLIVCG